MPVNRLDKIKDLEHIRDQVVSTMTQLQILINLLSMEDSLLKEEWQERGRTVSGWADEAEAHVNHLIGIILSGK